MITSVAALTMETFFASNIDPRSDAFVVHSRQHGTEVVGAPLEVWGNREIVISAFLFFELLLSGEECPRA